MHTSEQNGITNKAIVLRWLGQTASWDFKIVGWCTAWCKMMLLFCVKIIMKESHKFEMSMSEEEKKNILIVCLSYPYI